MLLRAKVGSRVWGWCLSISIFFFNGMSFKIQDRFEIVLAISFSIIEINSLRIIRTISCFSPINPGLKEILNPEKIFTRFACLFYPFAVELKCKL